jgi:hypothetical protein
MPGKYMDALMSCDFMSDTEAVADAWRPM